MKIRQLGNGGGLDFTKTNASFLIELEKDSYFLFDCGFNIMQKLVEVDKDPNDNFTLAKLHTVYISHMHEDHVGNLTSLIYHRYFMLGGLVTKVLSHPKLKIPLNQILKLCATEFTAGNISTVKMFYYDTFENSDFAQRTELSIVEATHRVTLCYGLFIKNKDYQGIFISGDTKADNRIELTVNKLDKDSKAILFHDFSNWNAVSKNVHACQNDIDSEYSSKFKKRLRFYHDGTDFSEDWITCEKTATKQTTKT